MAIYKAVMRPVPEYTCCCRPHLKMVEGFNNCIPHLAGFRARWLTGGPLQTTSRCPTSTGAVHNVVTFTVFMLVQLKKCVVVCGSDLQRGNSSDGCLSLSILFKYEGTRGRVFVLIWAMVRQVALGSVVSKCCTVSGMVFVALLGC